MRVAALISHPIQYYAPIFREMARRVDLKVFYGQSLSSLQQAQSGFGVSFDWDIDLLEGYESQFLHNVARRPGPDHFQGCNTPGVADELRTGDFDALLVVGWYLRSFIQGAVAAKRLGIPVLVRGDSHLDTPAPLWKRAVKRASYPALLRIFDRALYVGERSRAFYRHYGYPAHRLFRSPHCIDTQWFAEHASLVQRRNLRARLGVGPDTKIVLFSGKLVAFKRPIDVIEAAARVRAQGDDLHVMFAGSGELVAAVEARAIETGVPIHMLGFQNQSQMPAAYAASDALVIPSAHETWGLVANEALACGIPIIVSDQVGCGQDLATDGHVGQVFAVGDVSALAQCISKALRAPPPKDAIARLSNSHSVAAAVDGIEQALDSGFLENREMVR